jgi:hypothetical protein
MCLVGFGGGTLARAVNDSRFAANTGSSTGRIAVYGVFCQGDWHQGNWQGTVRYGQDSDSQVRASVHVGHSCSRAYLMAIPIYKNT